MVLDRQSSTFHIFVAFQEALSASSERLLERQLQSMLDFDEFRFMHGELMIRNLEVMDRAFPILEDYVEAVWTDGGKDLTDRYLKVYDTHKMRWRLRSTFG